MSSNYKNNKLKKIAGALSISLSVFLTIIKIIATIYTGSLAILSSLIDSISDILASTITFIAIKFSSKPASYSFRYGYGKAEGISSLFQSLFISASGIFILTDAIKKIINPQELEIGYLGIGIMAVSLVLTLGLVAFQKYVIKKTNSLALKADSAHYIVDITTNLSIIITLIVVKFYKIYWLDSVMAIFIALYLLHLAYGLIKEAMETLMDKELDEEIRENVKEIVLAQTFVRGIHDLRTRSLGEVYIFELHLELDGDISLKEAHEQSHIVEEKITKVYKNSQVVIHQDPFGEKEKRLDDIIGA